MLEGGFVASVWRGLHGYCNRSKMIRLLVLRILVGVAGLTWLFAEIVVMVTKGRQIRQSDRGILP
jgi:hypothetical protein